MQKSDTIKELANALVAFQKDVKTVTKDAENPYFHSKYATLEAIISAIKEPLATNGLSFSQFPTGDNRLVTILMHTSGEYLMAEADMHPKDNSPQSQGSAITYMRRYALSSILGLATEEDDDGNQATGEYKEPVVNIKPAKKSVDAYATACMDISKSKTIGEVTAIGDRVEKSTRFTNTQKEALSVMVSQKITELEPKEETTSPKKK